MTSYLNARTIRQLPSAQRELLNYQVRAELERQAIWRVIEALPMEEVTPKDNGDRVVDVTLESQAELKSVCRYPHLRYLAERAMDFGAIEYLQFSVKGGTSCKFPVKLIFMNPTI